MKPVTIDLMNEFWEEAHEEFIWFESLLRNANSGRYKNKGYWLSEKQPCWENAYYEEWMDEIGVYFGMRQPKNGWK